MGAESGLRVLVTGRVQGVGFRFFTLHKARSQGVVGYVRNLPDGRVEVAAEGTRRSLEGLLRDLREGPSGGQVRDVSVEWCEPTRKYSSFDVVY